MEREMIWRGAIAVEMVDGWTNEQIEQLKNALDALVEAGFEAVEAEVLEANPLARLAVE